MFCQKHIFLKEFSFLISKITFVFLYHVGFSDNQHYHYHAGASIPSEAMLHFQIPSVFDKFSDSVKNSKNVTFSRKEFDFHSPKFLTTFFSHRPQISNSPYFACFNTTPRNMLTFFIS